MEKEKKKSGGCYCGPPLEDEKTTTTTTTNTNINDNSDDQDISNRSEKRRKCCDMCQCNNNKVSKSKSKKSKSRKNKNRDNSDDSENNNSDSSSSEEEEESDSDGVKRKKSIKKNVNEIVTKRRSNRNSINSDSDYSDGDDYKKSDKNNSVRPPDRNRDDSSTRPLSPTNSAFSSSTTTSNQLPQKTQCCDKCSKENRPNGRACLCQVPSTHRRGVLGESGCITCGCSGCHPTDVFETKSSSSYILPIHNHQHNGGSSSSSSGGGIDELKNGCCRPCMKAFSENDKACLCQVPSGVRLGVLPEGGCRICKCKGCHPEEFTKKRSYDNGGGGKNIVGNRAGNTRSSYQLPLQQQQSLRYDDMYRYPLHHFYPPPPPHYRPPHYPHPSQFTGHYPDIHHPDWESYDSRDQRSMYHDRKHSPSPPPPPYHQPYHHNQSAAPPPSSYRSQSRDRDRIVGGFERDRSRDRDRDYDRDYHYNNNDRIRGGSDHSRERTRSRERERTRSRDRSRDRYNGGGGGYKTDNYSDDDDVSFGKSQTATKDYDLSESQIYEKKRDPNRTEADWYSPNYTFSNTTSSNGTSKRL